MTDDIELTSISSVTKRHTRSLPPMNDGASRLSDDSSIHPNWERRGLLSAKAKVAAFFRGAWNGPQTIQDELPRPVQSLLHLEALPDKLVRAVSYPVRSVVLAIYLVLWISICAKVLLPYMAEGPVVQGTDVSVVSLTCQEAGSFWRGKNADCGLDSASCPSLDHTKDVIFRCPALCDRGSWLYSLRAIGDQIVKYRGYFVGGGALKKTKKTEDALSYPYRADLFPCGAGVHAGVILPFFGGCARVSYSSGSKSSFRATKGHYGVSDSIEFNSFFPFSYYFRSLLEPVSLCYDPRLPILMLNMVLGIPVVFFGSGAAFYWIMAIVGYWTISLATDPPVVVNPQDAESLYELILVSMERFLPTCFVLYCLWKVSVRRTFLKNEPLPQGSSVLEDDLEDETFATEIYSREAPSYSPMTRLLLWYPFFWLGVLNNITFDRLPVDRLTWHDLQEQSGALLTVAIVGLCVVICIVAQAYYVWLLGQFNRLLLVYVLMFTALFALSSILGLTLRVHHYIFAMMFIPGCATRGRTAYVFQGLLLGLFLSGTARWGFASIVETNLSLLRGEPLGKIYAPLILGFNDGVILWNDTKPSSELAKYSDLSLLVNDVERYVGPPEQLNITRLFSTHKELHSLIDQALGDSKTVPVYLRLAKYDPDRKKYGDYTKASLLQLPSFKFKPAPPGIT